MQGSDRPTQWVLTFLDDGRAILSTRDHIERETYEHVMQMWSRFVESRDQIMIIGGCEVIRAGRAELEIGTDAIIVRSHDPVA